MKKIIVLCLLFLTSACDPNPPYEDINDDKNAPRKTLSQRKRYHASERDKKFLEREDRLDEEKRRQEKKNPNSWRGKYCEY